MAIETAKENIRINQIIGQKSETILVEGDIIIPDIKPDILRVVNTTGNICVYKKEITEGKIKIDGGINVYVMYLADSDNSNIRGLNSTIEFSQTIEIQDAKSGMNVESTINLKTLDCKILNGRKVSLKAMLDSNFRIYSNEEISLIKSVDNLGEVQIMNQDLQVNSLIGTGNTKVYAKDTLIISNEDNLADILKVDIGLSNKDVKISYNKVLAKADTGVKILYLTEDNRIKETTMQIPIMGFIDMLNISDDNICDVNYEIKNIIIKPNNVEEHSIYVEIEYELNCNTYENRTVNIIQDLYSPVENISTKIDTVKVMQDKRIVKETFNIREKQNIAELQGNKLYSVEVLPSIQKQNVLSDRIVYDGEVNLKFIYSEKDGVDTKTLSIPFNFTMESGNIPINAIINTISEITMQDFIIMPDESIEIKIDIVLTADISRNSNIDIIKALEILEKQKEDPFSMIIYFVKPGDSLWKIAKKFNSTIRDIAAVNNIENVNKIDVGQQLFIPKYVA